MEVVRQTGKVGIDRFDSSSSDITDAPMRNALWVKEHGSDCIAARKLSAFQRLLRPRLFVWFLDKTRIISSAIACTLDAKSAVSASDCQAV